MGNIAGTHQVIISTGDMKGNVRAGNIQLFMRFTDVSGATSPELKINDLHLRFIGREEKKFNIDLGDLTKIKSITFRRDDSAADEEWYMLKIDVIDKSTKEGSVFPVNRWVRAEDELVITEFDSLLPQVDPNEEMRRVDLERKRDKYVLQEKIFGAPVQVEILPDDENFSISYQFDILKINAEMKLKVFKIDRHTPEFSSLAEIESLFGDALPVPAGVDEWRSDEQFGNQKLTGVAPNLIELCRQKPEHVAISDAELEKYLEGKKLSDVLKDQRLYMIDLRYLADIECSDSRRLPGPTCLLYTKDSGDFVPVAIQLMPQPSVDNPVFTPSDHQYTWLAAKMWFNLAECSHHQSITHLGFTHLMMESVALCSNRRLSISHPIYKLLAPHFLYVMSINSLAIGSLVSPGEWVDKAMQIGRTGMFNIINHNWSRWNLKENGNLVNDLKRRGVNNVEALPNYHYRDDAMLLWEAIEKYVATVVDHVYDTPEKLKDDGEIQSWCKELLESAKFNGMPANGFSDNEELKEVLTVFIFTASVGHAAANFGQYDQYAFPPNYPSVMHSEMPKRKGILTEEYVVASLPTKEETLDVITITNLLSQRGTNELGNFEVQYAYDPNSLAALARLQADLYDAENLMIERNKTRTNPYVFLYPSEVPNAISI